MIDAGGFGVRFRVTFSEREDPSISGGKDTPSSRSDVVLPDKICREQYRFPSCRILTVMSYPDGARFTVARISRTACEASTVSGGAAFCWVASGPDTCKENCPPESVRRPPSESPL